MMLDIINQAITEYGSGEMKSDPKTKALVKKIQAAPGIQDKDKKEIIGDIVTDNEKIKEGVEQQSELILAAKDMMDKVTGYLEDLASMKTEGMLELADRIRDEMGADKADAFVAKIQPAIETAEATLTQTRQDLEFGATDAEAGGTEPEGREQRESKEVFETTSRIIAKLAGR